MKAYTLEKKTDAVAFGRKLVNSADRDIKHLESEGSKASGEAKEEYRKELRRLKADRAKASKKLDEMGKASGDAWDGAKKDFADAYKELRQGVKNAAAKLKRS